MKERAFRHIVQSLTVENVAYEVFSDFSAAFEDVRKVRDNTLCKIALLTLYQVEVNFFLEHWGDIRGSDTMRNVWQQIRLGRHPGFEEGMSSITLSLIGTLKLSIVWPLIATNLEFKPKESAAPEENVAEKS